jgi:tetratricopeptide (TPR) repeat protein
LENQLIEAYILVQIEPRHAYLIPYDRNEHFTGRQSLLAELREKLSDTAPNQFNHRVALFGLGGTGKTQLALEYVYSHKHTYSGIYWISGISDATLLSGFQEIASLTRCVGSEDLTTQPDSLVKKVRYWLNNQDNWLLVIDNVENTSLLDKYLPNRSLNQHTLLTLRNPNTIEIPAIGLKVGVLDPDEAVQLLLRRCQITGPSVPTDHEQTEAAEIVKELGYLPLAIDVAAAYIAEVAKDITKYLPRYRENRQKYYSRVPKGNWSYKMSVENAWHLSFEDIRRSNAGASQLLELFAFLSPDGILRQFVEAGGKALDGTLQEVVEDSETFDEALSELERFSLIDRQGKGSDERIKIHRLVQQVTRDNLTETQRISLSNSVIDLFNVAFPQGYDWNRDTAAVCRRFQDQVLQPLMEMSEVKSEVLLRALNQLRWFLHADGKYNTAELVAAKAYQIYMSTLGEQHPDTLGAIANLAGTYRNQGKWEEAVILEEKVLELRKEILGEQHPDTLGAMANLAATYWSQGKWEEAVILQEKVLELRKEILGEQHPDTLGAMANLAATYERLHLRNN